MDRIYLDNAATSWPKPEGVYTACDDYLRRLGAPGGRSAYGEATEVTEAIERTRLTLARMIGSPTAERIIFTLNCTDALNQAIHGLLAPGDHVVTSVAEHNSILRPLRDEAERGVEVSYVDCSDEGVIDPNDIRQAIRPNTRLVALTHASNVTGAVQPIDAVADIVRNTGGRVRFLVDAAQSAGHLPIDVERSGIDLLAAAGHKGLLGPLGTGFLYVRPGLEAELLPTRQGGTGSRSEEDRQPSQLPDRYESGNLNAVGIIGLGAGLRYLEERGIEDVQQHCLRLTSVLRDGLKQMTGVTLFGPRNAEQSVGVVSVYVEGYDPQELALLLDAGYRIQVRAGLHCAPRMHARLGTLERGGTLRLSVGAFNTEEQIATVLKAFEEIAAAAPV